MGLDIVPPNVYTRYISAGIAAQNETLIPEEKMSNATENQTAYIGGLILKIRQHSNPLVLRLIGGTELGGLDKDGASLAIDGLKALEAMPGLLGQLLETDYLEPRMQAQKALDMHNLGDKLWTDALRSHPLIGLIRVSPEFAANAQALVELDLDGDALYAPYDAIVAQRRAGRDRA